MQSPLTQPSRVDASSPPNQEPLKPAPVRRARQGASNRARRIATAYVSSTDSRRVAVRFASRTQLGHTCHHGATSAACIFCRTEGTLMRWPFRSKPAPPASFAVGPYRLDGAIEGLGGLLEFSPSEYAAMGRQFVGEKDYNALPVDFLEIGR